MIYLKKFESTIFYFLMFLLGCYIIVEVIELAYQFCRAIVMKPNNGNHLIISTEEVRLILPSFFSIMIGLELIDTLQIYNKDHSIKVLNIFAIGMTAIGRKLLTIDFKYEDAMIEFGIAALILALSCGYYLLSLSLKVTDQNDDKQAHLKYENRN